jgi:hypothetical protein
MIGPGSVLLVLAQPGRAQVQARRAIPNAARPQLCLPGLY